MRVCWPASDFEQLSIVLQFSSEERRLYFLLFMIILPHVFQSSLSSVDSVSDWTLDISSFHCVGYWDSLRGVPYYFSNGSPPLRTPFFRNSCPQSVPLGCCQGYLHLLCDEREKILSSFSFHTYFEGLSSVTFLVGWRSWCSYVGQPFSVSFAPFSILLFTLSSSLSPSPFWAS